MAEDRTRVAQDGADHFAALPSGFLLGKYQLEAVLGQGGFGITYRGRDRELDRTVAIKEYLPAEVATRIDESTVRPRTRNDTDSFQWGLERFLAEARALARFDSNPSIVRVHDYLQANGTAYMVMALIDGTPLSQIYRREAPLPEERLKSIVLPILDGLEDVHGSGFLHRDIKPSNILIRANGQPVLIDFGAARQSLGEKSRSITSVFTPGYAPFEQYTSSGKQGPWTDIYALAATLYHGISGMVPPQATDRSRDDPMPPAQRIGAGRYSPHFLAAVDRGLEVHENRRPQTVAQWRDMLTGKISAALPAAEPQPVPQPVYAVAPAPAVRSYKVMIALVLGLLVTGGAGAAVYFGLAEKAPPPETVQQRAERLAEEARLAAEEARKAQVALEAEAQRRAEQESQQRAREQQRRQEQEAQAARADAARREAERARQENDAQRQRAADEEVRRQQEADTQRRAELARAEQERRALEEARRKAEAELAEARKQAEEARKQAEELRQQAERTRLAAEAEAARKTEEARAKAEADAKRRAEEEAKKKAQEEAKAAEAKAKAEAEAKAKAEAEARRKAEEEARKRAQTAPAPQQQAAAPAPAAPTDPAAYVARHWPQLKNSVETAASSAAMNRGVRLGSVDGYDVLEVSDARILLRVRASVTPPYGPANVRPSVFVLAFQNRPPNFPVIGEQTGAAGTAQTAPAPAPQIAAVAPPADPAAYVKQHWRALQASMEPELERFLMYRGRRVQSFDHYDVLSTADGKLVLRLRLTVVQTMGYSMPHDRIVTVEFKNQPPNFPVLSVQ